MLLAVSALHLSRKTTEAWNGAGVRLVSSLTNAVRDTEALHVINLGNSSPDISEPHLWTPPCTVQVLSCPEKSRRALDDLLPLFEMVGDVWLKGPGYGGRGKTRTTRIDHVPRGYDAQRHINGQEYRVNTVAGRVVQVHLRNGNNGERLYRWIGVSNAPPAIIRIAKRAAERFGQSVLAWDTILSEDGTAYILEGNTCPGVNLATAQRIVDQILCSN